MPKGDRTKKVMGTDLGHQSFLYVGDTNVTKTWLLPVCDRTSREKTRQLIERSLSCWDEISKHIPAKLRKPLRWQLEGAAQSFGISSSTEPSTVRLTESEMDMLTEATSFAERMLALADVDGLYD
jgi:hypothetical protein